MAERAPAAGEDAPAGRPPWVVPLAPRLGERPRRVRTAAPPPTLPATAPPAVRPAWLPATTPTAPQAPGWWGQRPAPGWGVPPAAPARRGRTGRVLAVLAAMVVLLAAVFVVARPAREPVAQPQLRSGQANAPARSDPGTEALRLLQTRARAILDRDKSAFLGVVDRRRASYYTAQSRLFDRMATAPFAAYTFRIVNPSDDLATPSVRRRYAPAQIGRAHV